VLIQPEYVAELKAQAASAIATFNPGSVYQLVESLRIDYGQLGPFGIHP
jgi:hypothetical protein